MWQIHVTDDDDDNDDDDDDNYDYDIFVLKYWCHFYFYRQYQGT